jgi:hypothetical protein
MKEIELTLRLSEQLNNKLYTTLKTCNIKSPQLGQILSVTGRRTLSQTNPFHSIAFRLPDNLKQIAQCFHMSTSNLSRLNAQIFHKQRKTQWSETNCFNHDKEFQVAEFGPTQRHNQPPHYKAAELAAIYIAA